MSATADAAVLPARTYTGNEVAERTFLFTSESVSEGHPDKVSDRISDEIVDRLLSPRRPAPASIPGSVRVAAETLTTTNTVVIAGETRGPETITSDLDRPSRAHGDQGYRLRAGRVPLGACRRRGAAAWPVGRYRAGCRCFRQQGRRRRRPGHHVRLCLPRDAGTDAGADLLQPQGARSARQGAQGR